LRELSPSFTLADSQRLRGLPEAEGSRHFRIPQAAVQKLPRGLRIERASASQWFKKVAEPPDGGGYAKRTAADTGPGKFSASDHRTLLARGRLGIVLPRSALSTAGSVASEWRFGSNRGGSMDFF